MSYSVYKAASLLAKNEIKVFPVHGINIRGECTCSSGASCEHPGKHPVLYNWQKEATTDLEKIKLWFEKRTDRNYGIAIPSAIIVIDIDVKGGGEDTIKKLEEEYGAMYVKLQVHTGGGGRHLFFNTKDTWNKELRVKSTVGLLPGIDIRAKGTFVVGPGSKHKSGAFYEYR